MKHAQDSRLRPLIYRDGRILSSREILVRRLDPGRIHGRGVFETLRYSRGVILFLDEHVRRMWRGLKYLKLTPPFFPRYLKSLAQDMLTGSGFKEARVRLMIWQARRCMHWAIVALPYRPLSEEQYRRGFRLGVSLWQIPPGADRSHVKPLPYRPYAAAYQAAVRHGFDEALMLNSAGWIAEASRANVFFVRGNALWTPALGGGCLKGVTRQQVLQLARGRGFACREVKIFPRQISSLDEVFVTNSLLGIMPVVRFHNSLIGSGRPGSRTRLLRRKYLRYCREHIKACRIRNKNL